MLQLFKNLLGKSEDLKKIFLNGAIILDVRTPQEFKSGHIQGAMNIPVDSLSGNLAELKRKGKPIITCCRSGGRSAMALSILSQGGIKAYNGGPWQSLEKVIR
jgi:rhodanese-related sulfurtransferase